MERLTRGSLVEDVISRVRDLIDREGLRAGDRLPSEPQLVERLGVSRPVIREALGRLSAIGMVEVQRGRGMFVANRDALASTSQLVRTAMAISAKDLERFVEFRAAIEVWAARRAAELATPADIAELEALCDEMARKNQDYDAAIRLDFRFHMRVIEISGNELMRNTMEVLKEFIMAGMVHTTPAPREYKISDRIHRDMVQAIATGDPKVAASVAQTHVDLALAALEEEVRKMGGGPVRNSGMPKVRKSKKK